MSKQTFSDRLVIRTAAKIYDKLNKKNENNINIINIKKHNEEIRHHLDTVLSLYVKMRNDYNIVNRIISNNITANKIEFLSFRAGNIRNNTRTAIDRLANIRDGIYYMNENACKLNCEKDNNEFQKISSCQSCFDIICDIKTLIKENKIESIRENIITVRTNDIILSHKKIDYPFNSFLINFDINQIGGKNRPYTISSDNPHCCAHSENSIHPHVNDNGYLCEGIAGEAITMALTEGRILDLFSIVESILNEYNPKSPYIHLHTWDYKNQCKNCGVWINDVVSCDYCGNKYCEACMYVCEECNARMCASHGCRCCDKVYCFKCAITCPECGHIHCENCTIKCSVCGYYGCKDCTHECSVCKEKQHRHHKVMRRCSSCEVLICNKCSIKHSSGYYCCSKCYDRNFKEVKKDLEF